MKNIIILFLFLVPGVCSAGGNSGLYRTLERRYGLPGGVLSFVAEYESQHGRTTGKRVAWHVLSSRQQQALARIAQHEQRPVWAYLSNHYGAIGYMQIIPTTWRAFAQDGDGNGQKDILDPEDNLATGAYYLAWLIGKSGSIEQALKKYTGNAKYAETWARNNTTARR